MSPIRVLRFVVRWILLLALILVVIAGAGFAVVESTWGKDQIRALLVRQANQYLTARLTIGSLSGSLTSGLELGDVALSRDGRTLVAIDRVALTYALGELWRDGTTIQSLQLTRPRIVAGKQADGRWDLAALLTRNQSQSDVGGPPRRIEIRAINVVDANVQLRDSLEFGPAHVPSDFGSLNASLSFSSGSTGWTLAFGNVSWIGRAPDLTVTRLSGTLHRSAEGWSFDRLSVQTPGSAFTLNGTVLIGDRPTTLDLSVHADPVSFQEWAGVVHALENIAVTANFDVTLKGPLNQLDTGVTLTGNGGSVKGQITFDTTVPGWRGAGSVDVGRLDLARWLNRADRRSEVTGRVAFALDLGFDRYFPRGTYSFDGAHAMYMGYAADNLRAQGRLTAKEVVIDRATSVAYRANLTETRGSIGLAEPFPFHFQGSMNGVDLRFVPSDAPVPHVESRLAFTYDVSGRFSKPFIAGRATFAASEFLGAKIGAGTVGTIDTETTPVQFSGDGNIEDLNLHRLAEGLEVQWLQDPRYAGTISGRFQARGAGSDAASLTLSTNGVVSDARLFGGTVSDADVSLDIEHGTLATTFRGQIAAVDPSIAFADPQLSASLTGTVDARFTAPDFLAPTTTLADYVAGGHAIMTGSVVRGIPVDTATVDATLTDGRLTLAQLAVAGPAIAGTASGVIPLTAKDAFDLQYDVTRSDLAGLRPLTGQTASGLGATKGRLSGPLAALHAVGDVLLSNFDASGISALTMAGQYDVTLPQGARPTVRMTARASLMEVSGQAIQAATGSVTLASDRADFDLTLTQATTGTGQIAGAVALSPDGQQVDLLDLTVAFGSVPWRLERVTPPPTLSWNDRGLAITPASFVAGSKGDERIGVSGTWRYDGTGALRVTAAHVDLDTVPTLQTRYGGILDLEGTLRGTRSDPLVTGTLTITNGRVERLAYESWLVELTTPSA